MSERVAKVDLHLLDVQDQKHRLKIDIPSLAESILAVGQISPITVKAVGKRYQVIAGRRRFSALHYIQEKLRPGKKVKAVVYIKNVDALREELIKIDENIMRQQLTDIELDEAMYRRKQIYEELHPETKQHVSGGHARAHKGSAPVPFTRDAAQKLHTSRRSIEKAISRAAKASDAVKKARGEGLLQSKVDLLVTLEPKDQDILLPVIKSQDLSQSRALIDRARQKGAKAAVLYLQEESSEDPALKPLLREITRMSELLQEALNADRIFRGDSRHQNLKALESLRARLERYISLHQAQMGFVRAIRKRGQERKTIPVTRS